MRTPDITYTVGDRLPVLTRTMNVDSTPVDLTGYTVLLKVRAVDGSVDLVSGTCIPDPDQVTYTGRVTYAFTAGDMTALPAGTYVAWFTMTTAGLVLTVPNDGFLTLEVLAPQSAVWSYTGNPASRIVDAVRFLIDDTDSSSPKINDNEIEFLLAARGSNTYYAAADAAEFLAAKYSAKAGVSKTVGDLTLAHSIGGQATEYRNLARTLRARGAVLTAGVPIAGGAADRDPIFSIGMTDVNPL